MLHALSHNIIDNGRQVLTVNIDSNEHMVFIFTDKRTGKHMTMDTTYADYCNGSLHIHKMVDVLKEEFGKNE